MSDPASPTEKLVRRRTTTTEHDGKELQRRRPGTIVMAVVAILLLVHRRFNYDSLLAISIESCASLFCLFMASRITKRALLKRTTEAAAATSTATALIAKPDRLSVLCILVAVAMPWIINPIATHFGTGNGAEIVMLVSLGWGSLAFAILSSQLRTLSLSVVCSGFLTLFASFISDSPVALWFSLVWGMLCLWWLVNNHWSQVETAAAVGVQTARLQHLVFTLGGCVVFLVAAYSVADRIPVLRKLQTELMPTSGGTSGKDSAARRGVGNGDAIVAAKKHATSFGAVDTDLFLDSEKPSLFDVFSDEFGEPKKKLQRVERAQALLPQDVSSSDGKFTEANRSANGSEFSIERELPEDRKPVDDLVAESLMFWQGEGGVHLAAQRFEHFDGTVWTNESRESKPSPPKIETFVIGEQSWFGPSGTSIRNSISPFIDALPEALKFTRYRSPVIPTCQGMQMWCIDEIDRPDFFALAPDGCLHMPDREHVPDYTVVRMINSRIDLANLEELANNCAPGKSHTELTDDCGLELNRLAHKFTGDLPRGWRQVQAVVAGMRSQFKLERMGVVVTLERGEQLESPALSQFLQNRSGPDYLFATTAALMLDHLGYRTRLVAGFYANPKNYIVREGEISILPRDAHAWLEIDVGHGYWIPLEPSPGYREPRYSTSLWYEIKQHRVAIGLGVLALVLTAACVYWLRRWLVELASWLAFPILFLLSHRLRISCLTWLVEVRCRLAGVPRRKGTILRAHLHQFCHSLPSELVQHVKRYLESADRMWFGGMNRLSRSDQAAIAGVWRGLTTQALRQVKRQMSAKEFAEPKPH